LRRERRGGGGGRRRRNYTVASIYQITHKSTESTNY